MNRFLYILFAIFLIITVDTKISLSQNTTSKRVEERIEYINRYKAIAIRHLQEYKIPASITLAQACLESGNGKSTLAVDGNNHFGIKCHNGWNGERIYHDDDAPNECFRKYKNPEESFNDHAIYLSTQKRYASLFDIENNDYKKWANGLKAAGYATNPNYAKELINIIEDYQLYKFDQEKLDKESLDSELSIATLPKENLKDAIKDIELEGGDIGAKKLEKSPLYAISTQRQLYEENGRAYIFANEGDTYESIAKQYNLFNREIRKFNNLKRKSTPRPGEKVFLEK